MNRITVHGTGGCSIYAYKSSDSLPLRSKRNRTAKMDEETMWRDFYHKIVEEKAKENEQQEKSEHEIR